MAQAISNNDPQTNGNKAGSSDSPRDLNTIDWPVLVQAIKEGRDEGMEQLYKLFSRGIRYFLCRQLGPQELEDKVHDTFLIVVNASRRGDVREPERLMGVVRTVVRRQVAASCPGISYGNLGLRAGGNSVALRHECWMREHHRLPFIPEGNWSCRKCTSGTARLTRAAGGCSRMGGDRHQLGGRPEHTCG